MEEEALQRLLWNHWQAAAFRPLQLAAVQGTLAGRDVLLVLNTGGGKSLTFQLPPLYRGQVNGWAAWASRYAVLHCATRRHTS
jgi:superfamily II DNA helicase RecQ